MVAGGKREAHGLRSRSIAKSPERAIEWFVKQKPFAPAGAKTIKYPIRGLRWACLRLPSLAPGQLVVPALTASFATETR